MSGHSNRTPLSTVVFGNKSSLVQSFEGKLRYDTLSMEMVMGDDTVWRSWVHVGEEMLRLLRSVVFIRNYKSNKIPGVTCNSLWLHHIHITLGTTVFASDHFFLFNEDTEFMCTGE